MSIQLGYSSTALTAAGAEHTAGEIAHQPDLWREITSLVDGFRRTEAAFLDPLQYRSDLRIVLTGAGSSAFAGQVLAPVLARRLARRVDAIATTDIVSNPREYLAGDVPSLLVSIARSGDSPESVAAVEIAEALLPECFHLVVTCNPDGQLAQRQGGNRRSRVILLPDAANDRGFAMTSSFTGMVLAVRLALDRALGGAVVDRLAAAAEAVLARAGEVAALADRGYAKLVYLGSGALAGLSRESALKALELTAGRVVALSDSTLGFRHGPKAVLDERTLAVVYLSNDPYTRQYDSDIVAELRQSLPASNLVTIAARQDAPPAGEGAWIMPGLDDVDDASLALPAVLYAQMIALHLSLGLGCTPDNPFPSGQVNRVVRGVNVYQLPN